MANTTPRDLRVFRRLRLSVSRDESTSIERQRELIDGWAVSNGHQVVGWAEDVDVSGSIDPFDTGQLGEWLNNRGPEFDVVCVWKVDRPSRNAINPNELFAWRLDHDKTAVSTSEAIDLGTPVGRVKEMIGASGELSERAENLLEPYAEAWFAEFERITQGDTTSIFEPVGQLKG